MGRGMGRRRGRGRGMGRRRGMGRGGKGMEGTTTVKYCWVESGSNIAETS
jgi:hypothetical protein